MKNEYTNFPEDMEDGKCPACQTELTTGKVVRSWDKNQNPEDIEEVLYCPECELAWLCEPVSVYDWIEPPTDELKKAEAEDFKRNLQAKKEKESLEVD